MNFTEREIAFIKDVLKLNPDFDHMSGEDWIELEDAAGDYLVLQCMDKDYNPNDEGLMCEAILDKLP